MGFETEKTYTLLFRQSPMWPNGVSIRYNDTRVPYDSLQSFLSNWSSVSRVAD